jgi:hypothetical protein
VAYNGGPCAFGGPTRRLGGLRAAGRGVIGAPDFLERLRPKRGRIGIEAKNDPAATLFDERRQPVREVTGGANRP